MKYFFILSALFCFSNLFAQENKPISPFNIGLFGSFLLNYHSADFQKLPNCPSCSPGYESGNGNGVSFGALFEYNYSKQWIFGAKAGINNLNAVLEKDETTTVILPTGQISSSKFRHSIDATISTLFIEPYCKFNFYDNFFFSLGFSIEKMNKYDYVQKETIIGPGTFLDKSGQNTHSKIRNYSKGELKNTVNFLLRPSCNFSYLMPLNKNNSFSLEPQASFYFGANNIISDDLINKWKINSLSLSLALKYSPIENIIRIEEREIIDTVYIKSDLISENKFLPGVFSTKTTREIINNTDLRITEKFKTDTILVPIIYKLSANIQAVGVDSLGREIPNPTFIFEEFVSNRLAPLLNFVFFDYNSANIPSRYTALDKNNLNRFSIDSLFNSNTLDIYHNILNIIGKRLNENQKTNITLVGCNSNTKEELNNKTLSESRANSVKNYLVNTWNIDPKRIIVKSKSLPQDYSKPIEDLDKEAENRRVEIYSNDNFILEPIYIENVERKSNPAKARFKLNAVSEAGINNWNVSANQLNSPSIFVKNGNSDIPNSIDWDLNSDNNLLNFSNNSINFSLKVKDKKGKEFITNKDSLNISVITIKEKRVNKIEDYEINKFSLILFNFDNASITGENKNILAKIKSKILPNSEINIFGYTDITGDELHNKTLSETRAANVKKFLGLGSANSVGLGEKELFDNSLPEGRFYSRTVDIIVKNKK